MNKRFFGFSRPEPPQQDSGGGGHTIEDEGTPLADRSKLNFVGGGITATDDSGDDASVITVNEQTIGDLIEGSTNKATPIDADRFGFWDSVADILKHATWSNIKGTLKTYFDMLYSSRIVLTANRTYYIRTDGSDSNDGLTNTAGGAFLTIQKALNIINTIDFGDKIVTLQIGDGTYTAGGIISSAWTGGGSLVIQGNSGTPANVLVSITSGNCFSVTGVLPGLVTIKDMELRTTTGGNCINHVGTGTIKWSNIRFGACAVAHIWSGSNGSIVECAGNYNITGNATVHFFQTQGGLIRATTYNVTVSASLTFTYFAWAENDSVLYCYPNLVFSTTTATGTRYLVTTNSVVNVAGAGANFFPGNVAGSTSTGGQYV